MSLPSTLKTFRLTLLETQDQRLGTLEQVPRKQNIFSKIEDSLAQKCYIKIQETVDRLGRAMRLGQHRRLIDSLDAELGDNSLSALFLVSMIDVEVCTALAVNLTTLEQAYHWPRDLQTTTPQVLEDHKLAIQILDQPQLRALLHGALDIDPLTGRASEPTDSMPQTALKLARSIIDEIQLTKERGEPVSRQLQDTVNLLYRTCRNEWNCQGDYRDPDSHKEFGRLHEVMRASGTQRCLQELFEENHGLLCLQAMPKLLQVFPSTFQLLSNALTQLQYALALIREELFSVSVDEVIWGRAFANFSKAVGHSDISAGGGDAPVFWMLDSICGQSVIKCQDGLPEELKFRSRFFPSNMRQLMARFRGLPALRECCTSTTAPEQLRQAFKALERQRFELYEMHRKKAARIAVSLRAGQRGTSAGISVCPYANPEKSLASTLSAAVTTRFGADSSSTLIDATATAYSLMFNDDETVYSARVRFDFCTPLAIGPGDCILVRIQNAIGQWQTRTYSITYTFASHSPPEKTDQVLADAAEVYIRNKGVMSSMLCNQIQGCKVQLAVKPASHFRLVANTLSTKATLFVAQGGALGVFLAWLETQNSLTGYYKLVVATRQLRQMGFKDALIRLVDTRKSNLEVTVVLSKPDAGDVSFLQSAGIRAFQGRIDAYLDSSFFFGFGATYVCGTSSFGLEVVKAAFPTTSPRDARKRLDPITTSKLPPIRLHVAPNSPPIRHLREISIAELAQHNMPSDLWIAVGDKVYDITTLSKFHPGGEKILIARAGRQAKGIFESVHGGSVEIESMLQDMVIGQLPQSNARKRLSAKWLDKIVEIQNDITNHSRFEKLPNSSVGNQEEIPPTQVVYATVECFARDWCALLDEHALSRPAQCQVMRAWIELRKDMDDLQARAYSESFDDAGCCGKVLQEVFDRCRTIAGNVHEVLDDLKAKIARDLFNFRVVDARLIETFSRRIVEVIRNQT